MINEIKKINLNHSFIFFLLSAIFSLIIFKINNFSISPLICLLLILTIGVSHGSLDHIKGKKLFNILNIKKISIFYFLYIFIAISVIIIWTIIPSISLIIFLIVASFHFGKEDTQFLISKNSYFNQLLFFFKGLLIIFAPMFFHFDETVTIFKYLLVNNEIFYSTLGFIEKNKILPIGIILSTLSSIYLFLKEFEIKKLTIFLDYFSIIILNFRRLQIRSKCNRKQCRCHNIFSNPQTRVSRLCGLVQSFRRLTCKPQQKTGNSFLLQ